MEEEKTGLSCATCRKVFSQGADAYQLIETVIGLHGPVPIDDPLLFCSARCLKDFFSPDKGFYELPRRVP